MITEFQITNEIVVEFLKKNFSGDLLQKWALADWEQFKASKQPKLEWEISEYRGKASGRKFKKRPSGNWEDENGTVSFDDASINEANSGCDIYSVKRLSDGSTWTINDKFSANAGCDLTIKSFEIVKEGIKVWSVEYGFWWLRDLKKVPLFTTEDGVSIRDGDDVWFCNTKNWDVSFVLNLYEYEEEPDLKYFSTKEKAEAFRIMNQPLFSISDIHGEYKLTLTSIERWIEKAKDKLNPTT